MPLTEQTIAWLRQAAQLGQAGALADLDAIARLDALEARVASLEQRPIPGAVDLTAEADEPDDDAAQTLHVEACLVDQIRRHAPMAIGTAEAILYVVAAWLDRRGQHGCSLWLREQCAISQEEQGNG